MSSCGVRLWRARVEPHTLVAPSALSGPGLALAGVVLGPALLEGGDDLRAALRGKSSGRAARRGSRRGTHVGEHLLGGLNDGSDFPEHGGALRTVLVHTRGDSSESPGVYNGAWSSLLCRHRHLQAGGAENSTGAFPDVAGNSAGAAASSDRHSQQVELAFADFQGSVCQSVPLLPTDAVCSGSTRPRRDRKMPPDFELTGLGRSLRGWR